MNTKLELLGYDEKDIVKEEKIEIVIKKLGVNIHYKSLIPLSIFEKYIVKVIDKAESEKITLTKKEHNEVIVDVGKIANILLSLEPKSGIHPELILIRMEFGSCIP